MNSQVSQIVTIFSIILIGYASKKCKRIEKSAGKGISSFILSLTLPALVLVKLVKKGSLIPELIAFPFIGFIYNAVVMSAGYRCLSSIDRYR